MIGVKKHVQVVVSPKINKNKNPSVDKLFRPTHSCRPHVRDHSSKINPLYLRPPGSI